jgi:murein DD-endopeptidase MepM/ murein hydrolase activator NlpD
MPYETLLKRHFHTFAPLTRFDLLNGKVAQMDFSIHNTTLQQYDLTDLRQMEHYIAQVFQQFEAEVGLGGYAEERSVYQKSQVFDTVGGSRSIHLGVDIWLKAGEPIFAPLAGKVHSFQNNANFGDYGPTIILEHTLENTVFYTLYGHLSLESLEGLLVGKVFATGEPLATIGNETVNGNWIPHLHFQIITNLLGKSGDFFGVAPKSEIDFYLNICPNPAFMIK